MELEVSVGLERARAECHQKSGEDWDGEWGGVLPRTRRSSACSFSWGVGEGRGFWLG